MPQNHKDMLQKSFIFVDSYETLKLKLPGVRLCDIGYCNKDIEDLRSLKKLPQIFAPYVPFKKYSHWVRHKISSFKVLRMKGGDIFPH